MSRLPGAFTGISAAGRLRVRSGGRVVEGARLESEYTAKPYRGFESLPLRQLPLQRRSAWQRQCTARMDVITASDFISPRWRGNLRAHRSRSLPMITTVQPDSVRRLFCITALIAGAAVGTPAAAATGTAPIAAT